MDKAFPQLQGEAREQIELTHYLAQIDNPQLAFSVKQQKPNSLDAVVSTTLEMEFYLPQKGGAIGVAAWLRIEPRIDAEHTNCSHR